MALVGRRALLGLLVLSLASRGGQVRAQNSQGVCPSSCYSAAGDWAQDPTSAEHLGDQVVNVSSAAECLKTCRLASGASLYEYDNNCKQPSPLWPSLPALRCCVVELCGLSGLCVLGGLSGL